MSKNSKRLGILSKRRSKKPGSAPGTLEHIGEQRLEDIQLTIHDYDVDHIDEIAITDVEESRPYLENPSKTWIKVYGVHDIDKLKHIWSYFDLHPLIQEDIVNTTQRPKAELYENNMYFVLKMLSWSEEHQQIESEQVSIVLSGNFVLSFQETDRPFFNPILERLKFGNIRIRKHGVDYLTYTLIDAVVDHYFSVLEHIGERIEQLEDQVLDDPDTETLEQIHALRRDLIYFRKSVWPLRDMLNSTIRDESPFIEEHTKIFLRDVYDHMVQIIDNIENYRDMVIGMHDIYMSHVSNKMNEVMKVLTIIATIFIPLTFIAGIYGMNFDPSASPYNMPELGWYWGYPVTMLVMLIMAVVMVFYFWKKGWL
ncbi:MAG: magnesium/cobalt transporter CorA [Balneolaceae bacterium]|nr:magnesium/cobalt transporter CorA [Balneolaceae bacterium]